MLGRTSRVEKARGKSDEHVDMAVTAAIQVTPPRTLLPAINLGAA